MRKVPFLTLEKAQEIAAKVPTPFHIYDEAGIRSTARALSQAFAWNPGFREYFAVKATPNPYILQILHEEGCGCDCGAAFIGGGGDHRQGSDVLVQRDAGTGFA